MLELAAAFYKIYFYNKVTALHLNRSEGGGVVPGLFGRAPVVLFVRYFPKIIFRA